MKKPSDDVLVEPIYLRCGFGEAVWLRVKVKSNLDVNVVRRAVWPGTSSFAIG
jgi:hypothetical protein